jgi:outer membrane receptor for ferrienterochelin and colicins
MIKGTTIGTVTDTRGDFEINAITDGEVTIRIQGMGYQVAEQTIQLEEGKQHTLNFDIKTDALLLDQVVVTSDRNEVNRKDASVIVNVLSPKTFEANQSISMIDGLDFSPGVRTETNCQNCGFTQVRMNGLEGPYSQILINSRQVFSGLAGVYGLELIPSNMIQRVEVVRGGGSALYGGNAIAGTINVITKEPAYNAFQVGLDGFATGLGNPNGGETAYESNLTFNGSLVGKNFKSGVSFFGQYRNRNPYDFNGDGFSEMVMINNLSGGLSAFFKPGKLSKISLDLYAIDEDRRGGNDFDLKPHEADICEFANHKIYGASLNYDLFSRNHSKFSAYGAAQYVDRETYYGALKDPNGYGETDDITTNIGIQYTHDFEKLWFAHADLTVGTEYTGGWLEDTKLGAPGEPNAEIADQNINTFGTYVQADWKGIRYKLVLGLRYDHYAVVNDHLGDDRLVGDVILPRASFMYSLTPDLQLRLSYAKGYRAPQIFDEDLHIESSGARQVYHTNDPNLKQETSHSISTSLNYSKATSKIVIEVLGEGFFTRLQDPFANVYTPLDTLGNVEYLRINAEAGAQVYGANFEVNLATMKALDFQLGMTLQRSRYDEELPWGEDEANTTRDFVRTPNNYGYLTSNWKPLKGLMLSLTGTYTGSMLVPHLGLDSETDDPGEIEAIENGDVITGEELTTSDPFFDMGFRVAYTFSLSKKIQLELHTGVKNIFNSIQQDLDIGVYRDPGYIYGPGYARTVYFGLRVGNLF